MAPEGGNYAAPPQPLRAGELDGRLSEMGDGGQPMCKGSEALLWTSECPLEFYSYFINGFIHTANPFTLGLLTPTLFTHSRTLSERLTPVTAH